MPTGFTLKPKFFSCIKINEEDNSFRSFEKFSLKMTFKNLRRNNYF
ncbi:unnamed protein product [Larinioides sclopetarius]|uniref:Uncharacterized protein n=1 Tax=Larinioides sclopetarius TaxID=280406 RepID=A0AAV1YWB8_9ARAC